MTQVIELSKTLDWKPELYEDLFFTPSTKQIKVKGVKTGSRTVYRHDNNKVEPISIVGQNYKLITNEKLHSAIIDYGNMDLALDLNLSGVLKNKRFNLVYNVNTGNDFGSDVSDGGRLQPKVVVKNSYDGNSKLEILIGLFRMICSNMVVLPIQGKVAQFQAKHFKSMGNLKRTIHNFLNESINSEALTDIRDIVMKAKAETYTKVIPYSMFKAMPFKTLLPTIAGVMQYSEIPVIVSDGEYEYNLHHEKEVHKLIGRILRESNIDEDKVKVVIDQLEDHLYSISYNEPVNSHWQLLNLFIKIAQYTVHKQRRLIVANEIGRHFLTNGGYNG